MAIFNSYVKLPEGILYNMCIPYLANFAFLRRDADALVESPKVCRCWKGRSCYTPDTTDFCWENLGKSAEKPWICHDSDESIVVFHGFSLPQTAWNYAKLN
jgi:hypothetical protein